MREDTGGIIIWYTIKWLSDGSVSVGKLTFFCFFLTTISKRCPAEL